MNIKIKLASAPTFVLALYAAIVIFLTYTCCYAFRRPFTAGIYTEETLAGFDLKILYVLAQIMGFAVSKFLGTRLLPSLPSNKRIHCLAGMLVFCEFTWLGFAILPPILKLLCVFLSGIPLGLTWGLLFSLVEGRRISEVLNVGLSTALILASGLVKSLGQFVLDSLHVAEYWMPFVTGALALPLVLLCCYLLSLIPAPNATDISLRTVRKPMTPVQQNQFVRQFFLGICLLTILHATLTVFRELRDAFTADFWEELNLTDSLIFTRTEYPIAFIVLLLMFLIVFIRSNRKALNVIYVITAFGCLITISSTLIFMNRSMGPVTWMILSGLGLYMGFIPFTYMVERLIATMHISATTVFILYLADSFVYLGTTSVFVFKNFSSIDLSWSQMLIYTALGTSILALASVIGCYFYFSNLKSESVQ